MGPAVYQSLRDIKDQRYVRPLRCLTIVPCAATPTHAFSLQAHMKEFISGIVFTLVLLTACWLAPPPSLLERWTARTFPTVRPSPSQQVAVVLTGASSGIGRHAALFLAKQKGYTVFATVRKSSDGTSLQNEFASNNHSQHHGRLVPIVCDVTDARQIIQLEDVVSEWLLLSPEPSVKRTLAGIVNNVGTNGTLFPLQNVPLEDMRYIYDVKVLGPLRVYQTFFPLLRQYKARIVNIGSLSGQVARPFRGAYTVSKFALEGFTDTLRQELWHEHMSVSLVDPGLIGTGLSEKAVASSQEKYGDPADRKDLTDRQRQMLTTLVTKTLLHASTKHAPSSPQVTSEAIWHALSSPQPQTRYYPGSMGSSSSALPAWILPKLKQILPDRLLDQNVVA